MFTSIGCGERFGEQVAPYKAICFKYNTDYVTCKTYSKFVLFGIWENQKRETKEKKVILYIKILKNGWYTKRSKTSKS